MIRVDQSPDGPIAQTELLPPMVLIDGAEKVAGKPVSDRKLKIPGESSFSRDIKLLSMSSGGPISHDSNMKLLTISLSKAHSD